MSLFIIITTTANFDIKDHKQHLSFFLLLPSLSSCLLIKGTDCLSKRSGFFAFLPKISKKSKQFTFPKLLKYFIDFRSCQGAGLKKSYFSLFSKLLCCLCCDMSIFTFDYSVNFQVALVPYHNDNGIGLREFIKFHQPILNTNEALLGCNIVHNNSGSGAFPICLSD